MRRTKIIATLGPATDDERVLRGIIEAGADVLRFNMSHGDFERDAKRMAQVKKLREELHKPIATVLDTKGPEIRLGQLLSPVNLSDGQSYILSSREGVGYNCRCSLSYPGLVNDVAPGQRILIDDGMVELKVVSVENGDINCTVIHGGLISSRKGVNCPGMHFSMPFISDRDRADLAFGKEQDFDYIAASFTRCADDLRLMREELARIGWAHVKIIAKIENQEGLDNIDEIIEAADAVMVARGDMGVEIPLEDIPRYQKSIIRKTTAAGKQAITATQMLESMVNNPRPTRAEITDIANSVLDGTSVVMLSGETAAGKYPIESVRMMAKIAEKTEESFGYNDWHESVFRDVSAVVSKPDERVTTAISHATVTTAYELGAAAIVTVTESGYTARMVSRFRPYCPIIAGSSHERVLRRMNLSWGVIPVFVPEKQDIDELFHCAIDAAKQSGLVKDGDALVVTAGLPLGEAGNTNTLRVYAS